jgi:hypothetical protein
MRLLNRLILGLSLASVTYATPVYFSAVDDGAGAGVFPNSLLAYNTFSGTLTSPAVVSFESGNTGTTLAPSYNVTSGVALTVGLACTTCSATGAGVHSSDGFPNVDGFNTTTAGSLFYRSQASSVGPSSTAVTITFSVPVFEFGVYITGVEDFFGITTATFNDGASQSHQLADSASAENSSNYLTSKAGTQFFGFTDTSGVSSITFTTVNNSPFIDTTGGPTNGQTISRVELFAMDDLKFSTVSSIPEPGSMWLMLSGIGGLLAFRFLRKA